MPPRDWKPRVEDILESIQKIQRYTHEMDFNSFASNEAIVDAVIRNFEVIGEAARHIPETIQLKSPEIPWRDISDMRNVVIHEYFGISLQIIWDTIQKDLGTMVLPLQRLLKTDKIS